jgi:hypothetical protein
MPRPFYGRGINTKKLHGKLDSSILKRLEKKQDKFTSADIQNEMLKVMALKILRDVALNIRDNGYFSIMVDETTDQSNCEQVVIVIHHVDRDLFHWTVYGAFHQCYNT